jgi:hypothetical protein
LVYTKKLFVVKKQIHLLGVEYEMSKIKKLLLIITSILSVTLICVFTIYLYSMQNNDKLYVKNISGNINALNNTNITGALSDNIIKTDFRIINGKVLKNSVPVANNTFNNISNNNPGIYINEIMRPSSDANTKKSSYIDKDGNNVNVTSTDKCDLYYTVVLNGMKISIKTDVKRNFIDGNYVYTSGKGKNGSFSNEGGTKQHHYGSNNMFDSPRYDLGKKYNNKIFIYANTGTLCSGIGGIYEISEQLKQPKGTNFEQNSVLVNSKNIAPVDLEDGKVQIIGFEVVDDKLVLAVKNNGELTMKIYDAKSYKFIQDIDTGFFQSPIILCDYVFTVNGDYLNAEVYSTGKNSSDISLSSFFTIDTKRLECLLLYNESKSVLVGDIMENDSYLLYKNDTLYVIRKYLTDEYRPLMRSSWANSNCIHITAIKNNQSVYEGEIVSDANEDVMYQGEQDKYDARIYVRDFYNIRLS